MNDAVIVQFSAHTAHTAHTEYCACLANAAVHVHATVPMTIFYE